MKIVVTHDDGTEQDITGLVQVCYDVATHSMDWGSGFLDVEETDGLILLAEACQFPDVEEKIGEVWRQRIEAMPSNVRGRALESLAHERGAKWWGSAVKPTDEERSALLAEARARRTTE